MIVSTETTRSSSIQAHSHADRRHRTRRACGRPDKFWRLSAVRLCRNNGAHRRPGRRSRRRDHRRRLAEPVVYWQPDPVCGKRGSFFGADSGGNVAVHNPCNLTLSAGTGESFFRADRSGTSQSISSSTTTCPGRETERMRGARIEAAGTSRTFSFNSLGMTGGTAAGTGASGSGSERPIPVRWLGHPARRHGRGGFRQ